MTSIEEMKSTLEAIERLLASSTSMWRERPALVCTLESLADRQAQVISWMIGAPCDFRVRLRCFAIHEKNRRHLVRVETEWLRDDMAAGD